MLQRVTEGKNTLSNEALEREEEEGDEKEKLARWGEREGEGGAKVRTPLPQCGSV